MTDLARDMVAELKLPLGEFGAKFARIGGATGLREKLGDSRATEVIKERGRWGSDIYKIYQGSLLRVQLQASRGMGEAARASTRLGTWKK